MWIWLLDSCHVGLRAVEEGSIPREGHTELENRMELGMGKREGRCRGRGDSFLHLFHSTRPCNQSTSMELSFQFVASFHPT